MDARQILKNKVTKHRLIRQLVEDFKKSEPDHKYWDVRALEMKLWRFDIPDLELLVSQCDKELES